MLEKPITDRLNRRTNGIDPFVVGTLVAGLLTILLLVFANNGLPPDTQGLTLGPTQPNILSPETSGS